MNSIRYAGDTVLISETEDLQHILDKVLEEGESLRLPRNAKETNSVSVSEKQIPPK